MKEHYSSVFLVTVTTVRLELLNIAEWLYTGNSLCTNNYQHCPYMVVPSYILSCHVPSMPHQNIGEIKSKRMCGYL